MNLTQCWLLMEAISRATNRRVQYDHLDEIYPGAYQLYVYDFDCARIFPVSSLEDVTRRRGLEVVA